MAASTVRPRFKACKEIFSSASASFSARMSTRSLKLVYELTRTGRGRPFRQCGY